MLQPRTIPFCTATPHGRLQRECCSLRQVQVGESVNGCQPALLYAPQSRMTRKWHLITAKASLLTACQNLHACLCAKEPLTHMRVRPC